MGNAADHVSVLGEESALTGRVSGTSVTILGRFEGAIEVRGLLRVGRTARVKAVVRAAAVEVDGEFEGEIRSGSLAFGATAGARGVFFAERLRMVEGARVDGAVNLPPTPARLPPPAAQPAWTAAPGGAPAETAAPPPEPAPATTPSDAAAPRPTLAEGP